MWPRTDFLELLGIAQPLIQAPMSGFTPPALAAAVCNAGGLGSIGCAGLPPAIVREHVTTMRQATNRPFNLNFFVHSPPRTDAAATARVRAKLAPYFDELGLGPVPEPKEPFPTFDQERLDLALELRPRVVSFHFGLPAPSAVRRIKEAGCLILSSATTVAEARSLEANGADVVVAQGFEAGGHRGSLRQPRIGHGRRDGAGAPDRRCGACAGHRGRRHCRWARACRRLRPRCEWRPDRHRFSGVPGSHRAAASSGSAAERHG